MRNAVGAEVKGEASAGVEAASREPALKPDRLVFEVLPPRRAALAVVVEQYVGAILV